MNKWRLYLIVFSSIMAIANAISASFQSTTALGTTTVRSETTLTVTTSFINMTTLESIRITFDGSRNHFNIGGTSVT
jgi:hypothetical protein